MLAVPGPVSQSTGSMSDEATFPIQCLSLLPTKWNLIKNFSVFPAKQNVVEDVSWISIPLPTALEPNSCGQRSITDFILRKKSLAGLESPTSGRIKQPAISFISFFAHPPVDNRSLPSAGSGLYSTAKDTVRWLDVVARPITPLLLVSDRHLFFHRRPAGIEREGAEATRPIGRGAEGWRDSWQRIDGGSER
ncbi:hypothetical protein QYF36_013720 [Acer negundo]|nr:hypothetical protein QYF36_013720 [Acer negundo]